MNIKRLIPPTFLIMIFLFLATGCIHNYIKNVDESICKKCANFIEDGKTKKEEVTEKSGFYELLKTVKSKNGTILIFKFSTFRNNILQIYHLVLIFDENDFLKKHSVVRIR